MALSKTEHERSEQGKLFDVTCIVGSVYQEESGMSPHAAAMLLIGENEGQGEFTYPGRDGGLVKVIVSYPTHDEVEIAQ